MNTAPTLDRLKPRLNPMTAAPDPGRYERMPYRRAGRTGLHLPAISLGLWQNFGDDRPYCEIRQTIIYAFDQGITHFDLANNYGVPPGSAEENLGRILSKDLGPFRDELIIATKAGYEMWPGPYGQWGSRKHLLASLDQSLNRLGLDYVDVFYSHRPDPTTPLEETIGALDTAVRSGRALYAGISSYRRAETQAAIEVLSALGTPLILHQPSYSILNRWIEEDGLLDTIEGAGAGCITFSPLARGMLTDRYLNGVPGDSRAATSAHLMEGLLTEANIDKARALNEIAESRGQTLAQMALAWTLRDPRVTSTLVGVSSLEQLKANLTALERPGFTEDELQAIDASSTG